jgi:glycosyltransferase involved in cell wall biosynthesis
MKKSEFFHSAERTPGLCSVVCTTYNHAKYSRAAIESIVAQDYRPLEVVVVDDGSTDGNVEVIREALTQSRLPYTLIEQENSGNVAANANRALAVAKGEFILLTSLDDLLLPDCILSKMAMMLRSPSLVMVGNSTNAEVDGAGMITKPNVPNSVFGNESARAEDLREIEFTKIGTFFLQGVAFRADVLDAIRGFDEDITGDDLNLRTKVWIYLIAHPELQFAFLQQPGFAYRKHAENLHRNTLRQVRTVLDWRNRYFPERPLPDLAKAWVCLYFEQCLAERDYEALQKAVDLDPQISEIYASYRKTWQFYRRALKRRFFRRG